MPAGQFLAVVFDLPSLCARNSCRRTDWPGWGCNRRLLRLLKLFSFVVQPMRLQSEQVHLPLQLRRLPRVSAASMPRLAPRVERAASLAASPVDEPASEGATKAAASTAKAALSPSPPRWKRLPHAEQQTSPERREARPAAQGLRGARSDARLPNIRHSRSDTSLALPGGRARPSHGPGPPSVHPCPATVGSHLVLIPADRAPLSRFRLRYSSLIVHPALG